MVFGMNDRFKFRAFDKLSNEIIDITGFRIEDDMVTIYTGNGFRTRKLSEVDLIQCTGMKDKGDVYIYESDIVMCDSRKRTIKWANGKFWFVAEVANQHEDISEIFGRYYGKVQVIGNIHQHKHLLDEKTT